MKCHYEILNISRDADDSEIKTAYRKAALKWHPDKNLDNLELAKEQFQLVQQAYEVLSDRQERAWYDNHREQILKGCSNKTNFTDNSLDVFPYFTTSCFKGYGDDENGFYSVYRTVFEKIAAEDIEYMETEAEFDEIPKFGDSTSDYNTIVGPFYAYWMGYSTKKSYVWLDPYDIRETRERRVLKLIEKENKKVRAKAKKERNDEIRNLVAFVRKRDKRVQAHTKLLEEKNLENRKKQDELRKQKILERKKELHKAKENEQEWSKFENMSSQLKEIEKNLAEQFGEELSVSDESEVESLNSKQSLDDKNDMYPMDNLYCVACNKIFKTINAFDNHETSKKHRENVELLKKQMVEEENDVNNSEETNNEVETSDSNVTKVKSKKNKKKKFQTVANQFDDNNEDDVYDLDMGLSKKQKKKHLREQQILSKTKDKNKETNDEIESSVINGIENITTVQQDISVSTEEPVLNTKKKVKSNSKSIVDLDLTHCCVMCKSSFPSKNKLFDHLKKTGHSIALPEAQSIIQNKRKKRVK